jgi:hypothetical protein
MTRRPHAPGNGARIRRSHIFERDGFGHYVEPAWCSTRLFEAESFGAPGARVLDPCCGWGTILRAAREAGYSPFGSDIVDRRGDARAYSSFPFQVCDFLKRSPIRAPWAVVTNPPFDRIREVSEHALAVAIAKVAVLVPLARMPAAHWLERLPLETVWLLTPRPSMPPASYIAAGNEPGGGRVDFCWLVFNRQSTVGGRPEQRWLHRDRVQP